MKILSNSLVGALTLSLLISAAANAAPAATEPWLGDVVDPSALPAVELLSDSEMASTHGRFAPLALIGVVVGADLALASFFWGVYIPTVYGGGGVACHTCSNLSRHR
jgi:hypothetical protein